MTAQQILDRIESLDGVQVKFGFAFPYVQVSVIHSDFADKDSDSKEALFTQWLAISTADFRTASNNGLLSFQFLSPSDSIKTLNRGNHWLFGRLKSPQELSDQSWPKVVHFFGYKGGQARSTVLAVLARSLAESGFKVLMIDADLEAPSLPDIWEKRPKRAGSSLLGLFTDSSLEPLPLPCLPRYDKGECAADLIAARVPDQDMDWDYDAFTVKALLDPSVSQRLGRKLKDYALANQYDIVLVDHRTGASLGTLNWFDALPGAFCIFSRLDNQWRGGKRFYQTLAKIAPTTAGAIVSFKPDEENSETFRNRNAVQIEELNGVFEQAALEKFSNSTGDEGEGDWLAELDRWVMWPYDQSFRTSRLPASVDLGANTKDAIEKLRDLLELRRPVIQELALEAHSTVTLSARASLSVGVSGNSDEDDLIQTGALRELRTRNNPYSYVFGRKGTGKSRLFRALVEESLGKPLVADDDFGRSEGLKSSDLRDWVQRQDEHDGEQMWWHLLASACKTKDFTRDKLRQSLNEGSSNSPKEELRKTLSATSERVVVLVDGLETAFPQQHIHEYVASVFHVMRALQGDPDFREKIELKLFLRTDLARTRVQNLEQQIQGRVIWLSWDLQGILNFMLSRVASPRLQFFANNFSNQISHIKSRFGDILDGRVSAEDAFSLLLQILPDKVTRVNASMRTFLKLHFADSASNEERYYPRFVQQFLEAINSSGVQTSSDYVFRGVSIQGGRVSSALIQHAHDDASRKFLGQVRQELEFILSIPKEQIDPLLGAFAGRQTPFVVSETVVAISQQTHISEDDVRNAMENMKSLGIFEPRPGFENSEWRAGRLFKAALRMKLRR